MRILGGEARGRILATPDGNGTRPTDSRSREMLFNVLGARLVGVRFLDCYAGTGAVGLEALSRGAAFCVFIEQDHAALRAIRSNLQLLGYTDRAQVWQGNVRTALARLDETGNRFDIAFADPPFSHPTETREFCNRIDSAFRLLDNLHIGTAAPAEAAGVVNSGQSEGGLLILQHHRKTVPPAMKHFALRREKRAGESTLSFFEPLHAASCQTAVSGGLTEGTTAPSGLRV